MGTPAFAELLGRCDFPPAGTPVTAAVSGGPDSLALLVLARAAGLEVTAVHVDHGIRAGSAAEAHLVRDAAARLGARCETRTVQVAPGPDLEARARKARYAVLPAGVMTGHTMDDQAETVLINLLRGAGIDGLAGMRRRNGRVERPLIRLRRSETERVCDAAGLEPFRDPSNEDLSFLRNRIRAQVVPLLCEVAGRDIVPVLARQAELMGPEADLLDELAAGIDATDAKSLAAARAPLARRAVRRWLRAAPNAADDEFHPPSAAEVARVLRVARGVATACEVAGGRRVARTAGRLRVEPGAPEHGGVPLRVRNSPEGA